MFVASILYIYIYIYIYISCLIPTNLSENYSKEK